MFLLLLEYDGAASTCFQVITAAGNVKHEDIVALADKMFNKLSTDPTTTSMLVAQEPASFTGSEVCFVIFHYILICAICHERTLALSNARLSYHCILQQVRIIDDDMPLAQFAVAFNGASWIDPDSVALMVMQSMLGSWNKNAGGGKHMG